MSELRTVCPHGIYSEFVWGRVTIGGEEIVSGGSFWHDEDTRCPADREFDALSDADLLDKYRTATKVRTSVWEANTLAKELQQQGGDPELIRQTAVLLAAVNSRLNVLMQLMNKRGLKNRID